MQTVTWSKNLANMVRDTKTDKKNINPNSITKLEQMLIKSLKPTFKENKPYITINSRWY